jgi:hypothetical protein
MNTSIKRFSSRPLQVPSCCDTTSSPSSANHPRPAPSNPTSSPQEPQVSRPEALFSQEDAFDTGSPFSDVAPPDLSPFSGGDLPSLERGTAAPLTRQWGAASRDDGEKVVSYGAAGTVQVGVDEPPSLVWLSRMSFIFHMESVPNLSPSLHDNVFCSSIEVPHGFARYVPHPIREYS